MFSGIGHPALKLLLSSAWSRTKVTHVVGMSLTELTESSSSRHRGTSPNKYYVLVPYLGLVHHMNHRTTGKSSVHYVGNFSDALEGECFEKEMIVNVGSSWATVRRAVEVRSRPGVIFNT